MTRSQEGTGVKAKGREIPAHLVMDENGRVAEETSHVEYSKGHCTK